MPDQKTGLMSDHLSKSTSIFGLRLWVVLGVCVGAAFVLVLFLITLWLASKRSKIKTVNKPKIPVISKEIQEIRVEHIKPNQAQIPTHPFPDPEILAGNERQALLLIPSEEESPIGYHGVQIDTGKGHLISYPRSSGEAQRAGGGNGCGVDQIAMVGPDVSHLGWGHWYTLRELEASTNGFADENVIGEGGYGIVYHGVLEDNTHIAVKNLLNDRYSLQD